MNRRAFARNVALAPILLTGCKGDSDSAKSRLHRMTDAADLVILGLGNKAVTWNGAYAGSIDFGGVCCRAAVSAAADARSLAWIPWVVADKRSAARKVRVTVKTVPPKAMPTSFELSLRAQQSATLAISPAARMLAVFAAKRLQIFDAESGEPKQDLTDLIQPAGVSQPERMQLSADGERLIIGYQQAVTVLDVAAKEMLFSGEGRFPSISPDGQRAVFCRNGSMNLLTLPDRTEELDLGNRVLGIGTWSPDGAMLLAGVRPMLRAAVVLSAVDWKRRESVAIEQLPPDDLGERSCWIDRKLLGEQRAASSPR